MQRVLNTCTFVWLISNSAEPSTTARTEIRSPENGVFLSAVFALETAVKSGLGKLPLPEPAAQFVPSQRALHRIEAFSLDERAVLTLAKLPDLHRDPFDRMLICQAIAAGMTLVTPDPLISQYPLSLLW